MTPMKKYKKIQNHIIKLQEKTSNFKETEIGNQIFQFRITSEMIDEFKEPSLVNLITNDKQIQSQFNDLKNTYNSNLKEYQKVITDFEKTHSDVSFQTKKLINQFKKNQMAYQISAEKYEKHQQIENLLKSELKKVNQEKEFYQIHNKVYVENDKDNDIFPDNTLELTLDRLCPVPIWNCQDALAC